MTDEKLDAVPSRLYTKTGDGGFTNLYSASKLKKSDNIFDIIGTLDELSAVIGMICVHVDRECDLYKHLRKIQSILLDIGSDYASPNKMYLSISDTDIAHIESLIDSYDAENSKLTEFILPGVYMSDGCTHLARSVARRLERTMWKHKDEYPYITSNVYIYINRLSDLFFALARFLSSCSEFRRSEVQ